MAISEISIRDFAIIDQLEIELDNGLTTITGETGAGKSIILDALNLLLGARAEADMIRHGKDSSEISASFIIKNNRLAQQWVAEQELGEEDYCLVRRVIRRDKPAKNYINDKPVTLSSIKALGQLLVDLHGQHEHQSLLRKTTQRQIIDDYAQHNSEIETLRVQYKKIRELQNRIQVLQQNQNDYQDRIDLLEFQLSELEQLNPKENEFAELEQEHKRLNHANELLQGLQESSSNLFESDNNMSGELGSIIQKLEKLSQFDQSLSESCDLLNSALAQIDDSRNSIQKALSTTELDPERLQWVEQRMDSLINMARKHRCNENELPELFSNLQNEFDTLKSADEEPAALETELKKLLTQYCELANKISITRIDAAEALSKAITEQMQDLGMDGGELAIYITPATDEDNIGEYGIDEIDYYVSTNPGVPPKALAKTASGGELSRISLAIQVITSSTSQTPTLVFDEVDVGVGGRVADMVGQRLRQLGQNAQIICITHLPQVAAQGHQHLLVQKSSDGDSTTSSLEKLDNAQRTQEIARMLGGLEITERTIAHAQEMLQQAS